MPNLHTFFGRHKSSKSLANHNNGDSPSSSNMAIQNGSPHNHQPFFGRGHKSMGCSNNCCNDNQPANTSDNFNIHPAQLQQIETVTAPIVENSCNPDGQQSCCMSNEKIALPTSGGGKSLSVRSDDQTCCSKNLKVRNNENVSKVRMHQTPKSCTGCGNRCCGSDRPLNMLATSKLYPEEFQQMQALVSPRLSEQGYHFDRQQNIDGNFVVPLVVQNCERISLRNGLQGTDACKTISGRLVNPPEK